MAGTKAGGLPKTKPRQRRPLFSPSKPLRDARRELFAQHVVSGRMVKDAYALAGFEGSTSASASNVRWNPETAARIEWLLQDRVDQAAKRRAKAEKPIEDVRIRLARRMEALALGDPRDVINWDRKATVDADGNVTGFADELVVTPSRLLSADQAAMVKGAFLKSGEMRIEMADQLVAIEKLCKALGIYQESAAPMPIAPSAATASLGADAVEQVRRIAFLIHAASNHAAQANLPNPLTIEHEPQASKAPSQEGKP